MHCLLIVLYKENIKSSSTFISLLKLQGLDNQDTLLYIWDNSPVDFQSSSRADLLEYNDYFSKIIYKRDANNSALSSVYNFVANDFFNSPNAKYLTVLDQDSVLPSDFLVKINMLDNNELLVVPKVLSNKTSTLISPRYQNSYYLFKKYIFKASFNKEDFGEKDSCNLFAVGSGLTIPLCLWDKGIRFEEQLDFYGIDTEFCRDYSQIQKTFILLDSVMMHDASNESNESPEINLWRFDKYMAYWEYQLHKHSQYPAFFVTLYVRAFKLLYKMKKTIFNKNV